MSKGGHETFLLPLAECAAVLSRLLREAWFESDRGHYEVSIRNVLEELLVCDNEGLMTVFTVDAKNLWFTPGSHRDAVFVASAFICLERDRFLPYFTEGKPVRPETDYVFDYLLETEKFPLHKAAYVGRVDWVSRLLTSGRSVSEKDHEGSSPLIYAVCGGNLQVCQLLLDQGASVWEPGYQGKDLLKTAWEWPHLQQFIRDQRNSVG